MNEQQAIFDNAMIDLRDNKKNNVVYQIKLANGEEILAISDGSGWTNPVKINYMKNEVGQYHVVLTSWFVTAEKYYMVKIEDKQIVALLLADRGLAEYYKKVNTAHHEDLDQAMKMDGVNEQEIAPTGGDIPLPEAPEPAPDNTDPTKKYTHPDVRNKLTKAMMEGRFIPSANAEVEIH